MADTVTITKEAYDDMENEIRFLDCLKACGVDNWLGWDDAWEMYRNG